MGAKPDAPSRSLSPVPPFVWRICAVLFFLFAVMRLALGPPSGPLAGRLAGRQLGERGPGGGQRALPTNAKYAYATVVCEETHSKAAMVLVHSIKSTRTPHDVVVLTRNLSSSTRRIFATLGAIVDPPPAAAAAAAADQPLLPPDAMAGNATAAAAAACFAAKFAMWRLTQYAKVVFLDPAMLVLENIDDVFGRPQPTAAPDNNVPDRFNPGLLLLEPHPDTWQRIAAAFARLGGALPPGAEDLMFFNHVFREWPRLGAPHHLDYGYNAISKLGYSATWNQWVHPKLKVVHFLGPFERWDDMGDKHYPPTRRYDHLRWEVLRGMYAFLARQGVALPPDVLNNTLCQTDYMLFAQGVPVIRHFSVVIGHHGNLGLLASLLHHYSGMRFVHKLYVAPAASYASAANMPPFWNTSKPVEVLPPPPPGAGAASWRWLPLRSLETDCVLLADDSVLVGGPSLAAAFKLWLEHPHRIVGFFPAAHYRDAATGQLVHISDPREVYSMVATNTLLLHGDYYQSYTCSQPEVVKDYVDKQPECEDAAVNFLGTALSGTPPLLVMDPDKRVTQDGPHARVPEAVLSACLNDLEAMLGYMPLRNTSEAKVYLEHDVFTKVEFSDPANAAAAAAGGGGSAAAAAAQKTGGGIAASLEFQPIYDAGGKASGTNDENFRFASRVPRVSSTPEVVVMPSPAHPGRILCVRGNTSSTACNTGQEPCPNSYAFATYASLPPEALLLLGTTLLLHSRYGFDDRFHTPNILSNLFYPYPDYGFMQPARAFFYKRGSLEGRLTPWSRLLFKALLGDHIAPFRVREGDRPLCFERAVLTRRYRPVPAERGIVLREAQERAWAYCKANPAALAGNVGRGKGFSAGNYSIRVLLLHGDEETGYGQVANLEELVDGLHARCKRNQGCELLVVKEQNFTNFCQQVLHMGAAHLFISLSGDGTMNHVIFMKQGMKVLELVPFGTTTYDSRVLKVYQEASRWVGLEHSQLYENQGPGCPREDPSCRFFYRRRAMTAPVEKVLLWFENMKQMLDMAVLPS